MNKFEPNKRIVAWQTLNPKTRYQTYKNGIMAKVYRCGSCNKFVAIEKMIRVTNESGYTIKCNCPHCKQGL